MLLIYFSSNSQNLDSAQTNTQTPEHRFIHIQQFKINGNKKTKDDIILREIQFKPGESIKNTELGIAITKAQQQIFNTGLFITVLLVASPISTNNVEIQIDVRERWYIYPVPQFQIVDRNLNEWLRTYHADLNRVNYGVKFIHFNLSGRKDQLRITMLNGYTRNIGVSYNQPLSNKKLNKGFSLAASYGQSREIIYNTDPDNKIMTYNTGKFIINNAVVRLGYTIRNAIKNKHLFSFSYSFLSVNDSLFSQKYLKDYWNTTNTSIQYPDITYTFQHIDVDHAAYPLEGVAGYTSITKRGWSWNTGPDYLMMEGGFNQFFKLSNQTYAAFQVGALIKLPYDQPYFNRKALGYGENYLRGLEYYVIDGAAFCLLKTTVKKKLVSFRLPVPFHIKSSKVPFIPFSIFAKIYTDEAFAGIVKKYEANLNNKLLYTEGLGIDILSLYDICVKLEYSFNQLGQNGLFLHVQGGF